MDKNVSAAAGGPVAPLVAPSSAPPAAPAGQAQMGKDQFLQLLVAQISHQDPLNPMDDRDMVTQLAQFTHVEQAIETNRRLAALQGMTATQDRSAMAGLIGRRLEARSDTVAWAGGSAPVPVSFGLAGAARSVQVRLLDAAGRQVRALDLGPRGAGPTQLSWDGRDGRGNPAPAGSYRVQVQASDAAGHPVAADSTVVGQVTGVAFDDEGACVLVAAAGGAPLRVRPPAIIQIDAAPQPSLSSPSKEP